MPLLPAPDALDDPDGASAFRPYRIVLAVGGLALLAFGVLYLRGEATLADPVAGRAALAGAALVLVGLSLTSGRVAQHAVGLIYAFFGVVSAWQVALAYVNSFSPSTVFGLILVFIGCSAGLTSPWLLGAYSVVFVGAVGGLSLLVDDPEVPMHSFLATLAALAALGTFAQHVRQQAMQRLERLREDALAAARAKSEFLATMSHEIRTPLNGVIGMTDMLGTTTLSPDQRDYVQTIRASGDALLAVINDVLDFSRIEAGRVELEAAPFAVRPFVEDAVDVVAPAAAARGVELAAVVEPGVPHALVGDATRVRQVLLNLLGNAIKFTEAGSVVLRLGAERGGVALTVTDTGVGIPPERLGRLFDSFTQGDASTTRRYGGTGLGLAITKRLAELMGGHVRVSSRVGQGSSFSVWLPLAAGAETAPAVAPGGTVLVVDDHPDVRDALAGALADVGFGAAAFATAEEALAWLDGGGAPTVALVDHDLGPGATSADDFAERFRAASEAPLVALTLAGGRIRRPGRFDALVPKPVRRERLRTALLGLAAPAASAPSAPALPTAPLRVLLAEDHPVNRRVVSGLLQHLGQPVEEVQNGAEAVEAVARAAAEGAPYALVLMDVQMPELDGLEATRRIRQTVPPGAQPAVVALTANALAGDAERCLAAGMDAHLAKPVRLADLQRALAEVHAGTLGAPRPPSGPTSGPASGPAGGLPPPAAVTLTPASVLGCLRALGASDDALVDEILDAYLRSDLVLIDELCAMSPQTVAAAAHKLRSAAGTLGADALAHEAAAVEQAARGGDTRGALALADGLRDFRETVAGARDLLRRETRVG